MTKEKRLRKAKQHLEFWRDALTDARTEYVDACRNNSPMMDIQSLYLATKDGYSTLRELRKCNAIEEMKYAKERIAIFERIVK